MKRAEGIYVKPVAIKDNRGRKAVKEGNFR
jgi:hypothetical protein